MKRNQPGKAIKASECLAISAFLWCMSATAFTSPTVSPVIFIHNLHNIVCYFLLPLTLTTCVFYIFQNKKTNLLHTHTTCFMVFFLQRCVNLTKWLLMLLFWIQHVIYKSIFILCNHILAHYVVRKDRGNDDLVSRGVFLTFITLTPFVER